MADREVEYLRWDLEQKIEAQQQEIRALRESLRTLSQELWQAIGGLEEAKQDRVR